MSLLRIRLGSRVFVLTIKLGYSNDRLLRVFVFCLVSALARINVSRYRTHMSDSATVTDKAGISSDG